MLKILTSVPAPLSPVPLYFSSLSSPRTALHYLNAWNRLLISRSHIANINPTPKSLIIAKSCHYFCLKLPWILNFNHDRLHYFFDLNKNSLIKSFISSCQIYLTVFYKMVKVGLDRSVPAPRDDYNRPKFNSA